MDNGHNENFELVWNGEGMPDVLDYITVEELEHGRPYRFYVQAINFVGVGPISDITSIYACDDVGEVLPPELNGQ
jgi:hypothetical protein